MTIQRLNQGFLRRKNLNVKWSETVHPSKVFIKFNNSTSLLDRAFLLYYNLPHFFFSYGEFGDMYDYFIIKM